MKPMRSLPRSWLNNLSKERRAALLVLAILFVLLGALVLYQRYTMSGENGPLPVPKPDVSPGIGTRVQAPMQEEMESELTAATNSTPAPAEAPPVTQLSRPLAPGHKILKGFGQVDTAMGDMRLYTGIAYGASPGDAVLAAGPGTVTQVEEDPLDGQVVVIDHGHNLITRYAGLGKLMVSTGAAVTTGAIIGQVGQPGPARIDMGSHLQFQVMVRSEPVNPASYFPN